MESLYLKLHEKNKITATGELDVIFIVNRISGTVFQEFSDILLVECKNWKNKVGSGELRIFSNKMDECKSKVGIFFSKEGITGEKKNVKHAQGVINKAWISDSKVIIVITLKEIYDILEGKTNLYSLLFKKYYDIKLQ